MHEKRKKKKKKNCCRCTFVSAFQFRCDFSPKSHLITSAWPSNYWMLEHLITDAWPSPINNAWSSNYECLIIQLRMLDRHPITGARSSLYYWWCLTIQLLMLDHHPITDALIHHLITDAWSYCLIMHDDLITDSCWSSSNYWCLTVQLLMLDNSINRV